MNLKDAFIHMFKNCGNYYIYDVNTNKILEVSSDIYDYILLLKSGKCDIDLDKDRRIQELIEMGYFSPKRVHEIEHSYSDILPYIIKDRLNTITLQVTQQCNLRCDYCAYSGSYDNRIHENKSMDFELAKRGIDFIVDNSSESQMINIGFYGGEPLLRVDFIKACIDYALSQTEGKKLYLNMTTNGTLLTDDVADYLVEKDMHLLISLDGPKEIHDKNRRFVKNYNGTFDTIMNNIANIKKKYPEFVKKNISFNAVLDKDIDFCQTNNFFCNYEEVKDYRVSTSLISQNYSKEEIRYNEQFNVSNNYERFKFYLSKIKKLDSQYSSKLFASSFEQLKEFYHDRHIYSSVGDKEHPGGPCIPAVTRLFMDVNGTFYPCERVSELSEPMKIGNIYNGLDINKLNNILNIGKITEDLCKNCWAFRFCSLCVQAADNLNQISREQKIKNCDSVKKSAEINMKDYCTLLELGCKFEEDHINLIEV